MAVMQPTNVALVSETVTGAKTLDEGDGGVAQVVTATATITLPATVVGRTYTIINGGQKDVTVTVSPNASDKILGNGFTSADNKDAINTLGNYGDTLTLVANGTTGWEIQSVRGTWERQA